MGRSQGVQNPSRPRLPPVSVSGGVRELLQFNAANLRDDLLEVTGLNLGLRPPGAVKRGIPLRVEVSVVFEEQRIQDVHIVSGQFSHRWPVSHWATPFVPRHETILHYARWIQRQPHLL